MTAPTTRRVRIAVVISKTHWSCGGWGGPEWDEDDAESESLARQGMDPDDQTDVYFIEADVPIPQPREKPATIEGRVTK